MLHEIISRSEDCYRHADKARKRASDSHDPTERQAFLDMAERWMRQARRYQCANPGVNGFRRSTHHRVISRQFATINRDG